MHLEGEPILKSLEITGFKSFGSRKKLEFKDGITAIVGPNGSGKSNVADAIRWVMGEQKNSRMRSTKAEELIFHGTESSAKASLAEVSIVLDNSKNKFNIQASEVQITRTLYRSGESDYRLNNAKVNFASVEELLSSAGIGKNSYAVISQGMIEHLLTTSGRERKMLFDEAAGVRQYDIRRKSAKRKLATAQTDLEKVSAVIEELLPSQKLLQKQSQIVSRRKDLMGELIAKQKNYLSYNSKINRAEITKYEEKLKIHNAKLVELENELKSARKSSGSSNADSSARSDLETLQKTISELETKKTNLQAEVLKLQSVANNLEAEAESQDIAKSIKSLQDEIKKQRSIQELAQKKLALHATQVDKYEATIAAINERLKGIAESLETTRVKLTKSQKKEYLHFAGGLITTVRTQLRNATPRREIDTTMQRLVEMIEVSLNDNAAELALEIGKLQTKLSSIMAEREEIVELQTKEIIKLRSLELDITTIESNILALLAELKANSETKAKSDDLSLQSKTIDLELSKKNIDLDLVVKELEETQKKLFNLSQASQNSAEDTFDRLETIVVSQKNIELQIAHDKDRLRDFRQKLDELKLLSKNWFGKELISESSSKTKSANSLDEINKIMGELELISEIDIGVLSEASQLNERLEFLQNQRGDLQKAISKTENFIKELETKTRKQFMQNFEKLNNHFQSYFSKLFDGGEAKLELAGGEEFGIEIIATPPGKRTLTVAALSGGEKSLASLALLAAILATNPSPFIFLDEVDAALDDNNSTRFNAILKDLAKKSQIVVITHNHETMQAATNLFGVTTSIKGDSELLHLQLKQADELVETKV